MSKNTHQNYPEAAWGKVTSSFLWLLCILRNKNKPCPSPEVEFCLRESYGFRAGLGTNLSVVGFAGKIAGADSPRWL